MTSDTLLLRRIHPAFIQNGFVTSQAFRPTPKDESKLSVYDGDQITAEESFIHFTTVKNLRSVGTMAVTVKECREERLEAFPDPLDGFPQHAVIEFAGLTPKGCETKGKKLKSKADARGWLWDARPRTDTLSERDAV